jgi:hypothetical protein
VVEGPRSRTLPHILNFDENLLPEVFESESHVAAGSREIDIGHIHPLAESSHNLFKI